MLCGTVGYRYFVCMCIVGVSYASIIIAHVHVYDS